MSRKEEFRLEDEKKKILEHLVITGSMGNDTLEQFGEYGLIVLQKTNESPKFIRQVCVILYKILLNLEVTMKEVATVFSRFHFECANRYCEERFVSAQQRIEVQKKEAKELHAQAWRLKEQAKELEAKAAELWKEIEDVTE